MNYKKFLLILMFLLSACSKPLYSGTVIDKQYIPAHVVYRSLIMVVNKTTHIIPQRIHIPDEWIIWVQNNEEKDSWHVSEEYYNTVKIGDFVTR